MVRYIFVLFLCLLRTLQPTLASEPPEKETLLTGWFPWDPYQYVVDDERVGEILSGLDIELVKAIANEAGKKIRYEPVCWKQHQLDLKEGKRDFAAGATYSEERAQYVYFSVPYRYEENSFFVRRGEEDKVHFQNIDAFLEELKNKKIKVGVIDGFIYADPKINRWLEDPANQSLIIRESDDSKNIQNLLDHKIDGFLADRIVGATLIWRGGFGSQINELRLDIKKPIHLMFSKKTTPLSVLDKFNAAISHIEGNKQYDKIMAWYLYPVLLLQTVDATWFHVIEVIGTIAFAISGLIIAYRDRATIFGAFIFAVLPSIGGGIIRDLVIGRRPVGALQTPLYLLLVMGTVILGFALVKILSYWHKRLSQLKKEKLARIHLQYAQVLLNICDALGLAAFTVTGIVVTVLVKVSPLWLWGAFFAFVTGAGGGILRDVLSKERDIVSLRGDIYPEIAFVWGLLLALFLNYQATMIEPDMIRYAVMATVVGAFVTRMVVYIYKIPNMLFKKDD